MFKLDLLTPSGPIVKDLECSELTVPTVDGEIQVLENHTHILTQLSTGIMSVKTLTGERRHFSISTGVCKVLKEKISVLALTAEAPEKIDLKRAQKAKERAQAILNNQKKIMTDVDIIKQRRKIERAEARMQIANLK